MDKLIGFLFPFQEEDLLLPYQVEGAFLFPFQEEAFLSPYLEASFLVGAFLCPYPVVVDIALVELELERHGLEVALQLERVLLPL